MVFPVPPAPVHVEEPLQEVIVVATRSGFHINCTASGSDISDTWWLRDNHTIALEHFEQKHTTVRGRAYVYGQTEATVSSLAWTNHSATCGELDELSGSYTCVVSGRAGSVQTQAESAGIAVDLQCKSNISFLYCPVVFVSFIVTFLLCLSPLL